MTRSMTAYASHEREIGGQIFVWEIRSVNHRYLDIALRLPDSFRFMEADIRKQIGHFIKRGRVECGLLHRKTGVDAGGTALALNPERLDQLLQTVADIENRYPRSWQTFSALDVLNWPGILQQTPIDYETLAPDILALLDKTLKDAVMARSNEGQQLAGFIEERCRGLQTLAAATRARIPAVLQDIRNKIQQRLSELVASPDNDRLEQEMVYLAQRLDVSEELDRIEAHVQEILRVLRQSEPAGRRLDFLIQELNREANTLGSKSQDTETTRAAVDMKVLIEQAREQVQNLE